MTIRDAAYSAVETALNLDIENVIWGLAILGVLCILNTAPR